MEAYYFIVKRGIDFRAAIAHCAQWTCNHAVMTVNGNRAFTSPCIMVIYLLC